MSERFELARAIELQPYLAQPDGKNIRARRAALRKVVSNMIVNNSEMLSLYPDVLHCLESSDSEIKRMCFLYLETYFKSRPKQQVAETAERLSEEVRSEKSTTGIRAVALRTLSSIPSKLFARKTLELIPDALKSPDPYFRKTACFAVAKAWATAREDVEKGKVLGRLNQMLVKEPSPIVVCAAAQALIIITDQSTELDFVIDFPTTKRLATLIGECPEFAQISLLTAIGNFAPQTAKEADEIARYITPGLRHTNAAVAMGSARVLMMLSNYSAELSESASHLIFGPLLSQLNRPPEIQYSVLRNIQLLLLGTDPETLQTLKIPPQTFVCRASDLPYIRATKVDILTLLCNLKNADMVVKELVEFIHVRNDPAAQRRAITALAKLASRIESIAPKSVQILKHTLNQSEGRNGLSINGGASTSGSNGSGSSSSSSAAVLEAETQETAIAELIALVRRYPDNKSLVDQVLNALLNLDTLPKNEEARCAYFWLLGMYAPTPAKSVTIFTSILENITAEKSAVQLTLMTASIRLFTRFPRETHLKLVPQIFEITANNAANPDVRDRALYYWRLLSQNQAATESIVVSPLPPISQEEQIYDYSQIEDLELSLGYLSSIYLKPADKLFRLASTRQLKASPALLPRKLNKLQELAPPSSASSAAAPAQPAPPANTAAAVAANRAAAAHQFSIAVPSPSSLPSSAAPSPMIQQNTNVSTTSSSYFSSQPPPAPRPRNTRQNSITDQFQDMHVQQEDDQNVRLIDI